MEAQHCARNPGEAVAKREIQEALQGIRVVGRRRLLRAQRAGLSVLLPPGEGGRDRADRYVCLSVVDAILEEYKYGYKYENEYADVSVGMANRSS